MVGRRRGPLIVANPDSDTDSLSSNGDGHHHPSSPLPPGLSSIEPPAPIFGSASYSIPSDNVSGSSRSSPAPDTTPPPTPSQLQPPVDLNPGILGKFSQKDRPHVQQFEREGDAHGIARVPHHIRKPSSDALQNIVRPSILLTPSHIFAKKNKPCVSLVPLIVTDPDPNAIFICGHVPYKYGSC